MCNKPKRALLNYDIPYNERIVHYNFDKQSAISLASNSEEVERIIHYLRKKWRV